MVGLSLLVTASGGGGVPKLETGGAERTNPVSGGEKKRAGRSEELGTLS